MKIRELIGAGVWSITFYLLLAYLLLFVGTGLAIALFSLRHVLFGVPKIFYLWRKTVFGEKFNEGANKFFFNKWPNIYWIVDSFLYLTIALFVIIWFNVRLIDYIR